MSALSASWRAIGDVRVDAAAAQRIGERRRGDRATARRPRRPPQTPAASRRARSARARARPESRRTRARPAPRGARSSARRPPASRSRARRSVLGSARYWSRLTDSESAGRARRAPGARTPRRRACARISGDMRDPNGASSASASRRARRERVGVELGARPSARARDRARRAGRGSPSAPRRAPSSHSPDSRSSSPSERCRRAARTPRERPHAAAHQPRDDALEVRGERRLARGRGAASASPCAWTTPTARRQSSNRSRMSASQNSTRTGRRRGPLRVVALAVAIDAAEGDRQRHAALAQPHTCSNAGPTMRTRWPSFLRQR